MATQQSRSDEIRMRVENGDIRAASIPTQRLSCETPFQTPHKPSCELVYFFPNSCLWAESAKGFGQKKGTLVANSSEYYQFLIEHIFFLASTIGEGREGSLVKQFPTWTPVPSAVDDEQFAGFLIRVTYQVDPTTVASAIQSHITSCEARWKKKLEKGRDRYFGDHLPHYQRFRVDSYVKMCDYYAVRTNGDRSEAFEDLACVRNPYHPFRVFSLDAAIKKMRANGAHEAFCDRRSFYDEHGTVIFPFDGGATSLMEASQLDPNSMNRYFFPHVERIFDTNNEEFAHFQREAGVRPGGPDPMELDDNDSEAGAAHDARSIVELYSRLASNTNVDAANTLQGWKSRCIKLMRTAERGANGDPQRRVELRREAQEKCIKAFFSECMTKDDTADCGDALRAIAGWKDDYLRTHRNFKMPNPKYSSNLTRFGDLQAADAAAMESVWAINTAHQEVKSLRIAIMHVYFYSPFHCHTACMGPPGCGKSNAMGVTIARMIPGTYRDVGVESAKAKLTPGKQTDLMPEFLEDINPAAIGVAPKGAGGGSGGGSTSNTEAEALLKYRLTKGIVHASYKQVINGQHSMLNITSFCNTVMIIGTNCALQDIPDAISGRFNNIQFQHKTRSNAAGEDQGMFNKYSHAQDPALNPVKASSILRDQRNQLFHCIIELLIWGTVFERPDMSVGLLVWSQTLALAKRKGLHETGNIRHYERLRFHAETLMVEDAIDRVLDSLSSPLSDDEPFHIRHILEFEKHLFCSTEHAAFALGLLGHQYENPIILAVEKYFKSKLLRDKIQRRDLGREESNVSAAGSDSKFYYVVRVHAPAGDNAFEGQAKAVMQTFASNTFQNMHPQPGRPEVSHAMERLAALEITVEDPNKPGEKRNIPAMQFLANGEVWIAEALMVHHDKDRLKKCLSEVLCHQHTKSKNILYGRTKENCPYVWQSMKIQPRAGKKLVMERPGFFSPAVLDLARNLVMGVSMSAVEIDPQELHPDDIAAGIFAEIFSDTNHKDVDMDLDEWVAMRHAEKLGLEFLPPTRDAPGGSTSMDAFNRAELYRIPDRTELKPYPVCFNEVNPVVYRSEIIKDKARDPEKYSLRATLKRKNEVLEEKDDEEDDQRSLYSDGNIDDIDEEDEVPMVQPHGGFQNAENGNKRMKQTVLFPQSTDDELSEALDRQMHRYAAEAAANVIPGAPAPLGYAYNGIQSVR